MFVRGRERHTMKAQLRRHDSNERRKPNEAVARATTTLTRMHVRYFGGDRVRLALVCAGTAGRRLDTT